MPSSSILSRSSTSHSRPASAARAWARSAMAVGGRTLAGSLAMSRGGVGGGGGGAGGGGPPQGGAGEVADSVQAEVGLLAQTGDEDAGRGQAAEGMDKGNLVPLALDLALGDEAADGAVEGAVYGAGSAAGGL